MDIKELREKTDAELDRMITQSREALREFRFKVAARQRVAMRDARETRKTIARILTLKKSRTPKTK